MLFCGLADDSVEEVIDFFPTRLAAEEALREILNDERGFAETLRVVDVRFHAWRFEVVAG